MRNMAESYDSELSAETPVVDDLKEKNEYADPGETEELPTFFGVTVRPVDPLDMSFHSYSSSNPLDISFHKRFSKKSILKDATQQARLKVRENSRNGSLPYTDQISNKLETEVSPEVSSDTSNESKTSRGPRVKWNVLHVREYDITIGDNPCVSYGPPVSLDWCYMNLGTVDVEEYEKNREPRRTMRQMMMNYYYRKNLLMYTGGYTKAELEKAAKDVSKTRSGRAITRAIPMPIQILEDMTESAIRKTKRALGKDKTRVCDI